MASIVNPSLSRLSSSAGFSGTRVSTTSGCARGTGGPKRAVLGGSWVVISGVISPLI